MNLVTPEIKANELANGIHSSMGNSRNIIMKGIIIPPPPNPPAFAIIFINAIMMSPHISYPLGGNAKCLNSPENVEIKESLLKVVFNAKISVIFYKFCEKS